MKEPNGKLGAEKFNLRNKKNASRFEMADPSVSLKKNQHYATWQIEGEKDWKKLTEPETRVTGNVPTTA